MPKASSSFRARLSPLDFLESLLFRQLKYLSSGCLLGFMARVKSFGQIKEGIIDSINTRASLLEDCFLYTRFLLILFVDKVDVFL